MPCTDGGVPYPPSREEQLDAKAPAMLCAVLAALEALDEMNYVRRNIDWHAAGVTPTELAEWWATHKKRDAERRRRQTEQTRQVQLRQSALAKLSADERRALGI